jgi:hypothetical protein
MKIYIPYKHDDGEQLRFCLRAIEKNLSGYQDVILITDKAPWWFKGNTIHKEDVSNRKQFSIIRKLFEVNDERFIFWNDDHFLLRPLHINEIKNWFKGTISEALGKATGRYYTAVNNTINHFGDIRYYDIHVPCILTNKAVHRVFRLEWGDNEYIIKSTALIGEEGEEMKDCKINRPSTKQDIEERIKDRLFFSVGPNGWKQQMIKLMNEMFPQKSRFEI